LSATGGAPVVVEAVSGVDDSLVEAMARLVAQLSSSASPPGVDELERVVSSPATTLFVARDVTGTVVGCLTLAMFLLPTGLRAWVEDVVVEKAHRGSGAGTALVGAALRAAEEAGARTVDLTSRPDREAANRLYLRLGFEQRQTNVYRYTAAAG
jgi:ribosomal protein S18 acetylase RimI-like enzyme